MVTNRDLKALITKAEEEVKSNPDIDENQESAAIEEVTLMTMTVFKKYPNGNTYIDYKRSKSWIQGMQKVQKAKAKLKKENMKKATDVKIGEEEVY